MALPEVGGTFAGYQVLSTLGSGGMGAVYLVEHPHLLRREALKVISVTASDNTEFHQRFINEARTVATLHHPGIVAIHNYGVDDDTPWFTMTYLNGDDLTATPLPDAEIATIAQRSAEALDYAHRNQVVHRDVKPANIITTREPDGTIDQVVLLDFGIAKLANSTTMTATQAFIGTLAYTAPEIIDGQPASPYSDQYALACTIYELLTGLAPYEAPTPSAMMAALLSKPAPPVSVHRPDLAVLDPVFERALDKDPARRYPTCQALAADLIAVLVGSPGHAPTRGSAAPSGLFGGTVAPAVPGPAVIDENARTVESPPRMKARRRGVLLSALALVVVAVVAVGTTLWVTHPSQAAPAAAVTPPALTGVSLSVFSTCAIKNGDAYCWGQNDYGQLGDGTVSNRLTPTKVVGITDVTGISVAGQSTCAVAAGKAYCWGSLKKVMAPTEIPGLTNVTDISTNGTTTCAIADSFLYCWGTNSFGQLGDGTTTVRTAPTKVETLRSVTGVDVGNQTTCALATNDAYCFGLNDDGQIGDGTTTNRTTPTGVKNFTYPTSIVTGRSFTGGTTCARRSDQAAYCWGNNESGAIGDGTTVKRLTPVKVLDNTISVVTGYGSTCAITTEQTVKCWGDRRSSSSGDQLTPADVRGLTHVTAIDVASKRTCAIADDQLYCWGLNVYGELGDGSTDTKNVPTKVVF